MEHTSLEKRLNQTAVLVEWLYTKFNLGGTRVGFFSLIDLIPGAGEIISILIALYLFRLAHEVGVPQRLQAKMVFNILFDLFFNLFPILGDVVDTLYKAHVKNLAIIQTYYKDHPPQLP